MRNFRQICGAAILMLTLSLPVWAGVMEFPSAPPPPPSSETTSSSTETSVTMQSTATNESEVSAESWAGLWLLFLNSMSLVC